MEKYLYAEVYGFGLLLLIVVLSVIFQRKNKVLTIEQKLFGTLLIMDFFALATDLVSWLINGVMFEGSRIIHIVDYTIFYIFSGLVFFFWFMYEENQGKQIKAVVMQNHSNIYLAQFFPKRGQRLMEGGQW